MGGEPKQVITNIVMALAGLFIGGLFGYIIGRDQTIADEWLQKQMARIVNIEDMEEHEKLMKVRMARNNVKTTRTDGGPNAKMMRMRIRKRPRR